MRSDGPTLPNRGWFGAGAGAGADAGAAPGAPSERETPTWPSWDERPPRGARGADRWPQGYVNVHSLVLGASLCANVVLLLALLGLLLLGNTGLLAAGGPSGLPAAGAALRSPTAAASPSPVYSWLQVTPSSVQLGCAAGQRTQFVVLQNTGPQRVVWQATVAGAATAVRAGVALSPSHGALAVGASLPIQVQNTTRASSAQGNASEHGSIRFAVTSPADAGSAASLSYTSGWLPLSEHRAARRTSQAAPPELLRDLKPCLE